MVQALSFSNPYHSYSTYLPVGILNSFLKKILIPNCSDNFLDSCNNTVDPTHSLAAGVKVTAQCNKRMLAYLQWRLPDASLYPVCCSCHISELDTDWLFAGPLLLAPFHRTLRFATLQSATARMPPECTKSPHQRVLNVVQVCVVKLAPSVSPLFLNGRIEGSQPSLSLQEDYINHQAH